MIWMFKKEFEEYNKFWIKLQNSIYYPSENNEILETKRNLYFVYIKIDNEQKLAYKDRNTNKCYKVGNSYEETFEEYKDFEFIRDCTSFDL